MVACYLNFQFQVLTLLKGTKELGVAHFTVDTPQSLSLMHFHNIYGLELDPN
jgi:hypothetical protein